MSEWTPSDIESARERTDPSLSDETILDILNKALRETGQRSGVMFNHVIVRIYEQLRKEGQLQKMTQDRLKARSVSFAPEESLSKRLNIQISTIISLVHEFGLNIPDEILLDNEKEIQELVTDLLFEIPHPISESGELSLIAKRQLSRSIQEWYQTFQKHGSLSDSTSSSLETSKTIGTTSLQGRDETPSSIPSLPSINDANTSVPNLHAEASASPTESHFIQKTVDRGIQRILNQLSNLRFENINFPYSALYLEVDKILGPYDPCKFYSSFKAQSFFLNILEEGVVPLPSQNDHDEDFLVMLGFGQISFIRRPETKLIEPTPMDIHIIAFSPDLKAQGLGVELLYSNKDLLFDIYYKRVMANEQKQLNTDQAELIDAISTVLLNTKSGEKYGKPKNMNEARSLALFLINHLPQQELSALIKEAEAYGYDLARDVSPSSQVPVDTAISTYMFPHPNPAIELASYLDFINRYGMDTKVVPKIRKLLREYTHIQNELNAYLNERGIKVLRKIFQKTSITPVGKKGEIGILFLSEDYSYPVTITLTSDNNVQITSPVTSVLCHGKTVPTPPLSLISRLLTLFSLPSKDERETLFTSPKFSSPFYKVYRHFKQERGYPPINEIYDLPITVLDEIADLLEENHELVNMPEENVKQLVSEFRNNTLVLKIQNLLQSLLKYASAFTKPPDPMKSQFPHFYNFDAILPTQESITKLSEAIWEHMKQL